MKVLLVEDDNTMRFLMHTLLDMEGFQVAEVDCALNMEEFLRALHAESPSLILLDAHLGCRDGIDFLRAIREDEILHDVKVLISSGLDRSAEFEKAGADGFMLKPFMPDELIARIKGMLN